MRGRVEGLRASCWCCFERRNATGSFTPSCVASAHSTLKREMFSPCEPTRNKKRRHQHQDQEQRQRQHQRNAGLESARAAWEALRGSQAHLFEGEALEKVERKQHLAGPAEPAARRGSGRAHVAWFWPRQSTLACVAVFVRGCLCVVLTDSPHVERAGSVRSARSARARGPGRAFGSQPVNEDEEALRVDGVWPVAPLAEAPARLQARQRRKVACVHLSGQRRRAPRAQLSSPPRPAPTTHVKPLRGKCAGTPGEQGGGAAVGEREGGARAPRPGPRQGRARGARAGGGRPA